MGPDKKEMIEQLKFEIRMVEMGGYDPSVREPHKNPEIFRDSITCLNVGLEEKEASVTHEMNKAYYEHVVLQSPHELETDTPSRNPKPAKFIWVKEKYVLTDGDRSLEVYWVHDAGHTANLLMGYMPKEKLLFITDIFNQFGEPRPNDPPPGIVTPYYAALGDNLKRLNLDVEWIAPSHGQGVVSADVLKKALVGTVQAPIVQPAGY